jgi:hypothetical protein
VEVLVEQYIRRVEKIVKLVLQIVRGCEFESNSNAPRICSSDTFLLIRRQASRVMKVGDCVVTLMNTSFYEHISSKELE